MSAERSACNTCRFYQDDACHRHPPTWALWPADNQHPIMYSPYATFPHVSPSDWCGEHQLPAALKEKDGEVRQIQKKARRHAEMYGMGKPPLAYNAGSHAAGQGVLQSSNPFRAPCEKTYWITGWRRTARSLHKDEYGQGRAAFLLADDVNPYVADTPQHYTWARGYRDAKIFAPQQKGRPQW